tara:strand:+ start:85 stop:324 length:240 start_codon:yes stop_codon:yes gene_type:complete
MEDCQKIQLGTVLALLIQAGAIIWWASGVSASVQDLEEFEKETRSTLKEIKMIETKVEINRVILERLEKKLDQRARYPE